MYGEAFNLAARDSMIGSANLERPLQPEDIAGEHSSLKSTYLRVSATRIPQAGTLLEAMFAETAHKVHGRTGVIARTFSAAMCRGAD